MAYDFKPIIIDAGKQRRRRVKQLKAGEGPLLGEVHAAIVQARAATGAAAGAEIIPVVVVYERRPKRAGKGSKALFRLGLFGM